MKLYGESTRPNALRSDPRKAAAVTKRLFDRFARLYGSRWTEEGNDPSSWTFELGDFELEAVAYAVAQCEKRHAEWPPKLVTFKSICREYVPPVEQRIARERALEAPFRDSPKDSETAKRHKGYIRALLGLPGGGEKGLQQWLRSDEARRVAGEIKSHHRR